MKQIVTLTPSEFMMAVHNQSISPVQLSANAGLPTLKMRSFYEVPVGAVNEFGFEVVIGGVRNQIMTVTNEARTWHELLNISLASMRNGKTFEQALKFMLDNHYGRFVDVDDDSTVGIKALFDQVYYYLAHYENTGYVTSLH